MRPPILPGPFLFGVFFCPASSGCPPAGDDDATADDDDSAADDDSALACGPRGPLPAATSPTSASASLVSMVGMEPAQALEWAIELAGDLAFADEFLEELEALSRGAGDDLCPVGACGHQTVPFPAHPPSSPSA